MILFSFNQGTEIGGRVIASTVQWKGFSFEWYQRLIAEPGIWEAFSNSVLIALLVSFSSAVLGTLSAYAVTRYRVRGLGVFDSFMIVPIVIPEIAEALSALLFFVLVGIKLGFLTVTIGHIAFAVSFVYVVVKARMADYDRSYEEAAMSLGADEIQTFLRVTLPILMPGILAGTLLAFTLSFDDFVKTAFTVGGGLQTLPLVVWARIRFSVSPDINAIATIIVAISLVMALVSDRLTRR